MRGSSDSPIRIRAAAGSIVPTEAEPRELRPGRLSFRLEGAPREPAWQLRWSAGKLEFQVLPPETDEDDEERTVALFSPSQEQWAEFWHAVDELDVWTWSGEYVAPSRVPAWSLELGRGDRRVRSAGHGAFPRTGAPAPTPEFRVLIEALRVLVDGRPIG